MLDICRYPRADIKLNPSAYVRAYGGFSASVFVRTYMYVRYHTGTKLGLDQDQDLAVSLTNVSLLLVFWNKTRPY